jgi:MFS family permease
MFLKIPPALKHRRFTLLWAGLLISVAGSQMQLWALLWHIRNLTNLPIAVSGIGIARFLPVLIFSLVAGLVADLYNRRTVMFITQSAMTLTAVALAYLTWTGQIQLWHIYALTALQTVAASFDGPARQALVPNLVPQEDLPSAFSMMSIAQNVGAIVGPALSGIVISNLGQYDTYLFNAVSFLAVLAALVAMGPVKQEAHPAANPAQPGASRQGIAMALMSIREGIHFILSRPIILSSMLLDFFATFFSSANTLLPFLARDVLKVGVIQYGWLSASQSIGAVTAGVIISQRRNIRRQGTLLMVAVVIFGLATTLFGMSSAFGLTMLALILVGASDSVSTILRNTIRQLQTPDYIRGRMTSINQIFFAGGPQLGEIEAGVVAQAFGTPMAIISGGIGCLVAVAMVAWRWPQLGRYNGDEPVMASSSAD